jgi:hypothetical protein
VSTRISVGDRAAHKKEVPDMAHSRSGGSARSAITGRYVTRATAARHPHTTVTNARGANSTTGTHHRSAITGRYVTPATATRHPRTTVTEHG